MNAHAFIPAWPATGAIDTVSPIVFVDRVPEPALIVERMTISSPSDERSTMIRADKPSSWFGRQATIALPVRLNDQSVRWRVLAVGVLRRSHEVTAAGRDDRHVMLVDEAADAAVVERGTIDRRDWARAGGALIASHAPRPAHRGRSVTLSCASLVSHDTEAPASAAQRWTARGGPWRVESTFTLIPAWDASLEGRHDATYDRALSAGFPVYANVYRRWALNEDAAFAGEPFDLAALFGEDAIEPLPLPFGDALTLDANGERRRPSVEVSTDGEMSWAAWPGDATLSRSRAAVTFEDATLPQAYLAAVKTGHASVRVTASLRSPLPVERHRWRGNPFAGTTAEERIDLTDSASFRRVDPGSVNHAPIRAGVLQADEADDTALLDAALLEAVERPMRLGGRATWVLAGVHPDLRIGDRLVCGDETGIVDRITHRFDRATTILDTIV